MTEADEGGQRALRLGVMTALQCSARCVEIGIGGAVDKHQPATVLDEGTHGGGEVGRVYGRNVGEVPGHGHCRVLQL